MCLNDEIFWALARNDVFLIEQARDLPIEDALIAIERMLDTNG